MNKEKINNFFANSVSIRLLTSDYKDFILSFLYKVYGDSMEISIKEDIMIDLLREYIESFGELELSNPYKHKKVEEWLNEWCDIRRDGIELGGYLEKYRDTYNYGYTFSLSPQTVSVLRWVKELLDYEDGKYIATDSRFSDIFSNLVDMVRQSIDNKDDKRKQLVEQKEKIEGEIHDIDTGRYDFERLGTEAFQERFDNTTQKAKNLLSDFRQVERNIKDVLKILYERKLEVEATSGKLVAFVLEADKTWKSTPQGRSFSAFYSFLKNPEKQDEFKKLIKQVYNRLEEEQPDMFLEDLIGGLNQQAYEVQKRISRVMDELEKSLAERNNTDEKYVGQLVTEIKKLALNIIEKPPKEKNFILIEDFPNIVLPLDRGITFEESETKVAKKYSFEKVETVQDEDLIKNEFKGMNPLEKKRIQEQLNEILKIQFRISLFDLLQIYPISNGLSELLAYIEIATEYKNHIIDRNDSDKILVTKLPDFQQIILLPKIIFCQ